MEETLNIAVTTLAGLEEVLASEVTALGGTGTKPGRRVVTCRGQLETIYRLNLHCRTALRVLVNIDTFSAVREQDVYDRIRATNWRPYLAPDGKLFVQVVDSGRRYRNAHYLAQLVKDAVVDQMRHKYDTRPSVDKRQPDLRIHLLVASDGSHTLSIDSSGDGLHRRGYRRRAGPAPLNEVLAAGLLALSGYEGERPFVDPMCGSGTIAIEAASVACRRAPGLLRAFGFERWPNFDDAVWKTLSEKAEQQLRTPPHPIVAADVDGRAIQNARETAARAQLATAIAFVTSPFVGLSRHLRPRQKEGALLILNPPYDERLSLEDATAFYSSLGDVFKQQWSGSTAWVLSANLQAIKRLGLKSSRRIPLVNGTLEARLCRYDLY